MNWPDFFTGFSIGVLIGAALVGGYFGVRGYKYS